MRALSTALLKRSLWYFLPISGFITLVLLPMAALYEHSRRQTLQTRVEALLEAGKIRVELTAQEAKANTGVVLTVPSMQEVMATADPSPVMRGRLAKVFQSQLREYKRLSAMAVFSTDNKELVAVQRQGVQLPKGAVSEALTQAKRLPRGAVSFSPVLFQPSGQASLLLVRPVLGEIGERRGAFITQVSLEPLSRDFDRITNARPALERGYLLSGSGRMVNRTPGFPRGFDFAAHFPKVWAAMRKQPSGVVDTGSGLFLYFSSAVNRGATATSRDGLFLYDRRMVQPQLAVVIQVPLNSLYRTSVFSQPAGQSLILLLYLVAAGTSMGIAWNQQRLEVAREQEKRIREQLEALNESAGVGMCLCDPVTGHFLRVNSALCSFFDRPPAELMQCNWQELTHPDDLSTDQELAVQLHRGEFNSYRLRKRFLLPDGSSKWGDLVVACTRNADGSIRELIGQIADVSELVVKTTYLEAASSAGVIGVWDWDLRTNQVTWDDQMYRMYGVTEAQGISNYQLWEQALHPDDRAMAVAALECALKGGDPFQCQYRVVWPDRSVHDIRARGAIQCGHDGKPERMVGVNYEVTELVRKSAYLEAASLAGVVGVWDWEIASDVLTWDPVMYRLYGLRAEEFQGTREAWERAVHPDDKAFVVQELQAALRGWRDYQPRFRVIWPDGSIHYIQARSRTTYRDDGTPVRMIGVNYDITEQVERELEVEQQRVQLAATMDALLDPLLFLTLEALALQPPALRIAEVNPAACSLLGRDHAQLLGQPISAVLADDTNSELLRALMDVCRQRLPWIADEQRIQLTGGREPIYADMRAVASREGVVLSIRDVSERRRAALQLLESEERFRLLAENASDAVFLASETIIRWMSPAITPLLGWQPNDWIDHHFEEYCHPDDIALAQQRRGEIDAGGVRVTRLRLRDHAGQWRWVEVHAGPFLNAQGEQTGIAASMRTIDQEVAVEAELERRARIDELTGLLNRKEILERLARFSHNRRHSDGEVAVLFCDIDHFKEINDRHGHSGGDVVLSALARRLLDTTRQEDLVGRIGGDELLVVLNRMPSLEAAEAIAEKIHTAARIPLELSTGEVVVPTLSIGVTLIREGESVDVVVERADQAMYQAKQHGRDRVISFS